MNKNLKITVYTLVATTFLLSNRPTYAGCDITKAVYTDMNKKGYELRFNEPSKNVGISFATVTLWHPKRGNISTFEVTSSQGFGTVYFIPKSEQNSEGTPQISAYFLDSNLSEFNKSGVASYMFVAGLGSWDWYDNQMAGSRKVTLGNPMWKLSQCR